MPNALMMRYAATRGNDDERMDRRRNEMPDEMRRREQDGGRMNGYEQPGMAYSEYHETGMRQPYRHTRGDYDGAESRYRGRDGRWKAGRRSEYEGDGREMRKYETRRAGDDDDDDDEEEGKEYKVKVAPAGNVIEWPYGNPMNEKNRRNGRQIGFGAMNAMNGHEAAEEHRSGMHDMHEYDEGGMMGGGFNREMAEKWVRGMEPEDRNQPKGGKWTPEMIQPIAKKYGIDPNSDRFWEFYAAMNDIYSNTSVIAREYGITTPDYYAKLAIAWLDDRDAVANKAEMYYKYIVKH